MRQQRTPGSLTTRVLLAGMALLTLAAVSSAEFRLPASEGEQSRPAVASDPRGGVVVVWQEHFPRAAQPLNTIRFQRFDPSGAAAGPNFRVDVLPGDNARNPAVDIGADGSFVIIWEGGASEGRNRRTIWARRFTPDGSPKGQELRINTNSLQTLDPGVRDWRFGGPAVSIAPDGGFAVVWQDNGARRCNESNIVLRRFNARGEPVGEPTNVNSDLELNHVHPAVDHDAEGNTVVVWQKGAMFESKDERGVIFCRLFDAENGKAGPVITVSDGRGFSSAPSLAVVPSGSWVVAWLERPPDSERAVLLARGYASDGTAGPPVEVATTSVGLAGRPVVVMAPGEGPSIVWAGRADDPSAGTVIRARNMGSGDDAPGPATTLGPVTCLDRRLPVAASMPNGDLLAVWQVEGRTAIEGVRVRPSGREIPIQSLAPTVNERWRAQLPTEETYPDEEERREAARTLGCFLREASGASPMLRGVLVDDPSPRVRGVAAASLALVTPDSGAVLPTLIETAGDDSPFVREGAVRGLGTLGLAEAARPLIDLLENDADPRVRAAAASSLADIARKPDTGPTAATAIREVLLGALEDRSRRVREAVFEALTRLPKPPRDLPNMIFDGLYEEDPTSALDLMAKMGPAGKSGASRVQKALEHPEYFVRWRAVKCLLRIQSGRFSLMLGDPEPLVRAQAAAGLRSRGRSSLLANSENIQKAVRLESDEWARNTLDVVWTALQEASCADDWFARLDIQVKSPPVSEKPNVTVTPAKDLQTRLSEYVYILASPSGELTVELGSDASRMMITGEIGQNNPRFIVYQENHGDSLLAGARKSVLKIKSQTELAALVEASNPGWKERLDRRPPPGPKPRGAAPPPQED